MIDTIGSGLFEGVQMFRWLKRRGMQKIVDKHIAAHEGFAFHGQRVEIPAAVDLTLRELIAKGKYEAAEAALIGKYLPRDRPVIELGGCLGLISSFIANRLDAEIPLLVVEANSRLIAACSHNAGLGGRRPASRVLHAAIAYDGRPLRFLEGGNVHIGCVVADCEGTGAAPVTPVRLGDLLRDLGDARGYTLVCDIEGMELDLFEQDGEALACCALAIVELHPYVYAARGASLDRMLAAVDAAGFGLIEKMSDVYAFERRE